MVISVRDNMKIKTIKLKIDGRPIRRVIKGRLIDDLDINYNLPIEALEEKVREEIRNWRNKGKTFGIWNEIKLLLSEGYEVVRGGACIEVVTDEHFPLDILLITDHLIEYDRFKVTFSNDPKSPIAQVAYIQSSYDEPNKRGIEANRRELSELIKRILNEGHCIKHIGSLDSELLQMLHTCSLENPLEVIRDDDGCLEVLDFKFEGFTGLNVAIKFDLNPLKFPSTH